MKTTRRTRRTRTTTTIEINVDIDALAVRSSRMWEAAIESFERDGEKEKVESCRLAASECRDAWQRAFVALSTSETRQCVAQELREAELIARRWGDSSPEREALSLI